MNPRATITDRPTWQSIRAEIIRRISTRVWQPGALIPREIELAEEFGCARGTINRALQELANAGLLDRKRKAGTRVALNPVRKATLDIPLIRLDVEGRGKTWHHTLLEKEIITPPPLVTTTLGLAAKTAMLHLRSLHFAANRPFLYEDRWVNQEAVPDILKVDFDQTSANEWLVQNAPLTTGDIAFSATRATAKEAQILEAKAGDALFVVTRATWIAALPVTHVRLVYAPGFEMHTKL